MKISMYTTYITPPTLYAIIQSGNKEIITPATGINPSKKIMTANTRSCGNPKTINAITVRIQFTTAIKNCASITFPNDLANLSPKYAISS